MAARARTRHKLGNDGRRVMTRTRRTALGHIIYPDSHPTLTLHKIDEELLSLRLSRQHIEDSLNDINNVHTKCKMLEHYSPGVFSQQ